MFRMMKISPKPLKPMLNVKNVKLLRRYVLKKIWVSIVAALLDNYLFTNVTPREDEVARALTWTLGILERKTVLKRVYDKVCSVMDTFIN